MSDTNHQRPIFCPYCSASDKWCDDIWSYVDSERGEEKGSKWYFVRCLHCEARGPIVESTAKAVRTWNRRPRFTDILAESLYNAFFDAREGLDSYGEEMTTWKQLQETYDPEWEAWQQVAEWVLSTKWTIRLDEQPTDQVEASSVHSTKPTTYIFDKKDSKA